MASGPRRRGFADDWKRLKDRVRRLELRPDPTGGADPVEAPIEMLSLLRADWVGGGAALDPTYYRDRGRVYLSGVVGWEGVGTQATLPFAQLPVGYRPLRLQNAVWVCDMDNTTAGTQKKFWTIEFLVGGADLFNFDPHPDYMGSPNFGHPPESTYFILDGLSFRHE